MAGQLTFCDKFPLATRGVTMFAEGQVTSAVKARGYQKQSTPKCATAELSIILSMNFVLCVLVVILMFVFLKQNVNNYNIITLNLALYGTFLQRSKIWESGNIFK